MQDRLENVKKLFLHSLGDIHKVQKDYFNEHHTEFLPDVFINYAIDDCRAYFGVYDIPPMVTDSVIAELAAMRFRQHNVQNTQQYGIKSSSYTEGSVSKSETYFTPQEWISQVESVLKPYNRFRVVIGHEGSKNTG